MQVNNRWTRYENQGGNVSGNESCSTRETTRKVLLHHPRDNSVSLLPCYNINTTEAVPLCDVLMRSVSQLSDRVELAARSALRSLDDPDWIVQEMWIHIERCNFLIDNNKYI
jgi:hypothetical protein